MENLFDYIKWRGDIEFSASPFNEVDGLLLSQLSYINFSEIVSGDFSAIGITMEEAATKLQAHPDFKNRSQFSTGINPDTMELFIQAAKAKRFSSLLMKGFTEILDLSQDEQFSAMAYDSKQWLAVIYRGTDGNIVGWKEDCKLGCMDEVPAQRDALSYLEKAASVSKKKIIIAGHSKGGNLSIYSATNCCSAVKEKISSIYNYDGPGFKKEFFETDKYKSVEPKIKSFVPKLSIVGMLFCHPDNVKVVTSENKGAMQHDPLSWQVGPVQFPEAESTARESKFISSTVNGWIDELSIQQRNQFVDGVFGILEDAEIRENDQFKSNSIKSIGKVFSAYTKMDSETRRALQKTVQLLIKNGWKNLVPDKYFTEE